LARSIIKRSSKVWRNESRHASVSQLKFKLNFLKHAFETNWAFRQEGWLSPTERASVSAISLRHILASPGYAPGTIAVNVTWMKSGFNACQTHRSMYPFIFNRFPVIQPVSSKVRLFSTFLHMLAYPGYAPATIAVNVTWMEREINAGQKHNSIYPSIFNRLRAIERYWSEIATFFLSPCI